MRKNRMKNVQIKKKGVRVGKGETALQALQNSVPHWIHHKVEDTNYVSGFKYLPICDCSECGYTSNTEHDVCPHCGAKMHTL